MRLILDAPRDAALNMSIDEMLMQQGEACLRIYFWERPSISIGYFQNVEEIARQFKCEKKNIPVVRRITGGGLVFHGNDLTFSLVLRSDNPYLPRYAKESYLKVTEALRIGLRDSYPGLDYAPCQEAPATRIKQTERVCFEKPSCYDLLLKGKKVMGASQRRLNGMILHQSTVFLGEARQRIAKKIIRGFEMNWKLTFREELLTEREIGRAAEIKAERYSSKQWAFACLPAGEPPSGLPSSQNIPGNYKAALQACGHN